MYNNCTMYDICENPKKTLKRNLQKAKGECPDRVHSDQMVPGPVGQEAGPCEMWPKALVAK